MTTKPMKRKIGFDAKSLPKFLFLLILPLIVLGGCADEAVDEGADCLNQLDNRKFQAVADNASCSYYERGSAELGLAGFLLENFTEDNATDNFPAVFNMTPSGCSDSGTDSISGENYSSTYGSTYQKHLLRAQYWARTKASANGRTRTTGELEISFFSTLAELIVNNSCYIDSNLDGTITTSENEQFSRINTEGSEAGSSNLNAATDLYQIILDDNTVWLCDTAADSCREDSTHEGVWDNADSSNTTTYTALAGSSNISVIHPIVAVERLQQLFVPSATPSDVTEPLEFLRTYTRRAELLKQDLSDLGIEEDDELYEAVAESVDVLDNGGTCTSNSAQVIDLLITIVENAAHETPATTYEDYNLLNIDEISNLDTGESAPACPLCSGSIQVRLIYKDGASYTGLYNQADSAIENTLSNLATLTLDENDELIPVVEGDRNIALKELICAE